MWLADEFPAATDSGNGLLSYFAADLTTVLAASLLNPDSQNSLYLGDSSIHNWLPAVMRALTSSDPFQQITINLKKEAVFNLKEMNLSSKLFPKSELKKIKFSSVQQIESEKNFDQVILRESASEDDFTNQLQTAITSIKPKGRLVIYSSENTEHKDIKTAGLTAQTPKLPIGKLENQTAVLIPEECDWGPGYIQLFHA